MSSVKPAPAGYGSLLNFTSLPQRFSGLLVEEGYVDEDELESLGFFAEDDIESFYSGIGKILENEGLRVDLDFEDEDFRIAVKKTVLRADLRKELKEGYGGSVQQNKSDSLTDYLVDSGVISKDGHIDNYTEFFAQEGVLSGEYDEDEVRESMAKVVTKAMLDSERQESEVDEGYIRPFGKYIWDIMSEEMGVKPVPVQIPGERGYWAEPVTKEGLMLGAVESDEKMTVMTFAGLDEKFYQELVADENKESDLYDVKEVEVEVPEEIREDILEEVDDDEIPETTRYLVMNPESPQVNKESGKGVNLHYHRFIEESEELIGEELNQKVGEWVVENYFEETDKIQPVS